MAALACALAAHALRPGSMAATGAMTAYELFGAKTLLERICEQGFELLIGEG
jgi:hypothetical protein